MAHGAIRRWFRGLLPTIALLCLALGVLALILVSTVGLPSAACRSIERALAGEGIPLSVGNIRLGFMSGLTLKIDDVSLYSHVDGPPQVICHADRVRVNLGLSSLLHGEIDLNNIRLKNATIDLPTTPGGERSIHVEHLQSSILLSDDMVATIERTDFSLQGMNFSIDGDVYVGPDNSRDTSKIDLDSLIRAYREPIDDIVRAMEKISWPAATPPSWQINLSQTKDSPLRLEVNFKAPALSYDNLTIVDAQLSALWDNNTFNIHRLNFHTNAPYGSFSMQGGYGIADRTLGLKFDSSIPLIRTVEQLTQSNILPTGMTLQSLPSLAGEVTLVFAENMRGIEKASAIGSFSLGEFRIGDYLLQGLQASYSYKDGRFYLNHLQLRAQEGIVDASLLGEDQRLRMKVESNLPLKLLLGITGQLAHETIKLPEHLDIDGSMNLKAEADLDFSRGWKRAPNLTSSAIHLELDHLSYQTMKIDRLELQANAACDFEKAALPGGFFRNADLRINMERFAFRGEELGSLKLTAQGTPQGLTLDQFELSGSRGTLNARAQLAGYDLSCELDSTFPASVIQRAFGEYLDLPSSLTLPEELKLGAFANISLNPADLASGRTFSVLRRLSVDASLHDMAWHGEKIDTLACQGEISATNEGTDASFSFNNVSLVNSHGRIDLTVNGTADAQTRVIGKSTLRADSIDRLLDDPDVHHIINYFRFNPKSQTLVTFQAMFPTADPASGVIVKGDVTLQNLNFRGADTSKTTAGLEVSGNKILLQKPVIVYDNTPYLSSKGRRGPSQSTLKADYVLFDLDQNTVTASKFRGEVFPAYALRMFAPAAAKALDPFYFLRPALLTGSGVYPLGDDMSRMKSTITFSTTGSVYYKMLGTTLDLLNTRGVVEITPRWVNVRNLNCACWNGLVEGALQIQIDDRGDALNGEFRLRGLSLPAIARSYDTKFSPATVNVTIAFTSDSGNLSSLKAQGHGEILNGNLIEFPIFGMIGRLLGEIPGVNHIVDYNIKQATLDYIIKDNYIITNNFYCSGTNMSLSGNGSINLENLLVNSHLRFRLQGLSKVILLPVSILTTGMLEFHGTGPLSDVKWTMTPYSGKSRGTMRLPAKSGGKR